MTSTQQHLDLARTVAKRSGIKSYSTGAVIIDKMGPIATGWSHYSELRLAEYRSIHAEVHAIFRANSQRLMDSDIYVVTIRNKSGREGVGRPCKQCMAYLYEVGIKSVTYTVGDGYTQTELVTNAR